MARSNQNAIALFLLPIAALILNGASVAPRQVAIVIGVGHYPQLKDLPCGKPVKAAVDDDIEYNVPFANNDARDVTRALRSLGFQVTPLIEDRTLDNEKPERPTLDNVRRVLVETSRLEPVDRLIVFFSGHTRMGPGGASNLLLADENPNAKSAGVSIRELVTLLRQRTPAREAILIIDACKSSALQEIEKAPGDVKGYWRHMYDSMSGLGILTSSSPGKPSWPTDDCKNSRFTKHLLDGLSYADGSMRAAANHNKVVSLEELWRYTASADTGGLENPDLLGDRGLDVVGRRPDATNLAKLHIYTTPPARVFIGPENEDAASVPLQSIGNSPVFPPITLSTVSKSPLAFPLLQTVAPGRWRIIALQRGFAPETHSFQVGEGDEDLSVTLRPAGANFEYIDFSDIAATRAVEPSYVAAYLKGKGIDLTMRARYTLNSYLEDRGLAKSLSLGLVDTSVSETLLFQSPQTIYGGGTVRAYDRPEGELSNASAVSVLTSASGNQPGSFTLELQAPRSEVYLIRTGLFGGPNGVTHPHWTAIAFDAEGNEIARVSEEMIRAWWEVPAALYVLRPHHNGTKGIKEIQFWSDGGLYNRDGSVRMKFAAFDGVVLDGLILGPISR